MTLMRSIHKGGLQTKYFLFQIVYILFDNFVTLDNIMPQKFQIDCGICLVNKITSRYFCDIHKFVESKPCKFDMIYSEQIVYFLTKV